MVEHLYDQKGKVVRTDNGGEYTLKEFECFLNKEGNSHQVIVPKIPEQKNELHTGGNDPVSAAQHQKRSMGRGTINSSLRLKH